ncbi:hypothetical protein NPX13_g5814 [Xylaria arbuscula]|uniref:Uncharacterized protein n=1 Tax=Xylaria arbuscula TaxID=114810 RepID=A0A9W8ND06_9PEZI|nr:hypothetical protein NPX13_g5814 [Xylaria arbuscula]
MMKYVAVTTLLAANVQAFWTDPLPGHPTFTIGTDLVLEYTVPNTPPAESFIVTLRAENSTPYGYIPGPFGSMIGLYDLRDRVLERQYNQHLDINPIRQS